MKDKFYYNFYENRAKYDNEARLKLINDVKETLANNIVGMYVQTRPLKYDQYIFYTFEIKDILLENMSGRLYYIIVNKRGKKFYTHNIDNFLNITKLIDDLNRDKPNVSFPIYTFKKIEKKLYHKIIDKIKIFFGKYVKESDIKVKTIIDIKLKRAYYLHGDLVLTGEDNVNHVIFDPSDMNIRYISENDPFGEEDWGD